MIGALPTWRHSSARGATARAAVSALVVIVIILVLMGRI
ncbi:MAG: DUF3309 family protein [Hyphomicrobiales bacterium]